MKRRSLSKTFQFGAKLTEPSAIADVYIGLDFQEKSWTRILELFIFGRTVSLKFKARIIVGIAKNG